MSYLLPYSTEKVLNTIAAWLKGEQREALSTIHTALNTLAGQNKSAIGRVDARDIANLRKVFEVRAEAMYEAEKDTAGAHFKNIASAIDKAAQSLGITEQAYEASTVEAYCKKQLGIPVTIEPYHPPNAGKHGAPVIHARAHGPTHELNSSTTLAENHQPASAGKKAHKPGLMHAPETQSRKEFKDAWHRLTKFCQETDVDLVAFMNRNAGPKTIMAMDGPQFAAALKSARNASRWLGQEQQAKPFLDALEQAQATYTAQQNAAARGIG